MDDVYLGIVAKKAKINLVGSDIFIYPEQIYSGPKSYKNLVATHGFNNPEKLVKVWGEVHKAGFA